MEHERTRKIGSLVVGLMVVGMVSVAPVAVADADTAPPSQTSEEPCVTIEIDDPGVSVDPENCKPGSATSSTEPWALA